MTDPDDRLIESPSARRSAFRRPRRHRRWPVGLVALLAACSSGADRGGDATVDATIGDEATLAVSLERVGESALPLGEPLQVTVTVANDGPRSVATPIELALVSPDGAQIPFHRTSLFVPFGESTSESLEVTTSRWFAETGEFEIRAAVTDAAQSASLPFSVEGTARLIPSFEDVTDQAGVVTEVPVPVCGQFSNGAAWADVDSDGWQDLLVTRLGDPVQLYMSRGDGTFAEEGVARGLAIGGANGAAFADYDNDGHADLVLVRDGPDLLFHNDGTGHFEDVSEAAGIGYDESRGMSASWGDFDGDGLLDLYVTTYMECTGEWTTEEEIIANVGYYADVLYHNEGDGTFTDVTSELPDSDRTAAGFAAAWLDVDGDQRLDLYVANDFVGLSPDHNRLWRNNGPGPAGWQFTDVSLDSGAGLYMNTMGIGVGDVDRDGDFDMALSNIGGNKLLRSGGDGTFVEEAGSGIERPNQSVDYSSITWGTAFYDLDLDGWEDLFMAAGNLQQAPEIVVGEQPNMVFLNDGTGMRFLDVSALTGADDVGESKGVAFADFDRDGAIDMFVVNQAGAPRLYRNVTPRTDNHWLQVDPVGTVSNRDGCGARLTVEAAGEALTRSVLCGSGGSGSAHQRQPHFGLGPAQVVDRVEVLWPSGIRQVIDDVTVDEMLVIEESAA